MSVIQCLLISLFYWFGTSRLWYGTTQVIRQPLILAIPIGLVMGDLHTAMLVGGTLQLIYLGTIAPGGNIPADEAFAACVAIPIAIQTGITAQVAVSLAVPVGLLGVLLDTLRRTYGTIWVRMADKAALNGDRKGLERATFWYPLIAAFPLRVIPAFLAAYFGADAVKGFMSMVPTWFTNGLSVAGGILPALGFAVTIIVIGKKSLLPYFIVGFLIVAYSGMGTIGVAALGICIALLQSNFASITEREEADNE